MTSAERQKRVELALEAVGLSDRADHYPRQLSGGQEQRVGIARAIVAHPQVVVADEPTGSLDAETAAQIQELLKRLNKELNITMLMVTHDAGVAAIANRQIVLNRGRFCGKRLRALSDRESPMLGYVLKICCVIEHESADCEWYGRRYVCVLPCRISSGRARTPDHRLRCRS